MTVIDLSAMYPEVHLANRDDSLFQSETSDRVLPTLSLEVRAKLRDQMVIEEKPVAGELNPGNIVMMRNKNEREKE